MKIRKYTTQDLEKLIHFWSKNFPDDPPHNDPSRMIDAKLLVDDLIFLAEKEKEIIGACMAGYDGHRGWLYAVAVSPEHRRTTTGTQLVRYTLKSLKKRGCIKVNLQIRTSNNTVLAFYESLGFSIEERISMGAMINAIDDL